MHETIQIGEISVSILRRGDETGGQFCLCEVRVPPGASWALPDAVMHLDWDELVIGSEGETQWKIGASEVLLRPGGRLWIPRRMPHHFRNCTRTPARFTTIYQPGVIDPFLLRGLGIAMECDGPRRTVELGHALARLRSIPVSDN